MAKTERAKLNFIKFKNLTGDLPNDVPASFERMAKLLEGGRVHGSIQFQLRDEDGWKTFGIRLEKGSSRVEKKSMKSPDLEVMMRVETWNQIASGSLAPLEAFVTGRMRVRGKYKLGPQIIHHLAGSEGKLDIC